MLPMRVELIISSLQDWCLTTMALEAIYDRWESNPDQLLGRQSFYH